MNADQLREAAHAILAALDAPDPTPDPVPIDDIIEAEAEATTDRIEAEAAADAVRIEAQADAAATIIEAEAAAEVEVIEAAADAEVEVIEAAAEVADVPEDDGSAPCVGDDCDTLTDGLGLDDAIDAATDVLDGLTDDAPLSVDDVPPAATHWWTRRRTFARR